jgi:small subunit ribosomal protein S2
MPPVSMRQLLEAGVHFGHQTRRWNPKMRPYIFAERNGIHIIDLAQTVERLDLALDFVRDTVARGDSVLFVGTKKQAQEPITQEATRANQPYVTKRWLGGMLTNFVTIRKRIGLLEQLEARQASGEFERIAKKEAAGLTEELNRLDAMLGGIRKMKRQPGAVFIVDPHRERIAVTEANKLEIPVVGTGDTNVDPDELDYIIPANDDAIRSIRLLCQLVADACIEGARERAARAASEPEPEPEAAASAEPEFDENASEELVAALAGGGVVSFEPDVDDDELLPEGRPEGGADGASDGAADATTAAATPTPAAATADAAPERAARQPAAAPGATTGDDAAPAPRTRAPSRPVPPTVTATGPSAAAPGTTGRARTPAAATRPGTTGAGGPRAATPATPASPTPASATPASPTPAGPTTTGTDGDES